MKLDPKALGKSLGLVAGLFFLLLTLISIPTGFAGDYLLLASTMLPGYNISFIGGMIGFLWCFILYYILGYAIAHFYGHFSSSKKKRK